MMMSANVSTVVEDGASVRLMKSCMSSGPPSMAYSSGLHMTWKHLTYWLIALSLPRKAFERAMDARLRFRIYGSAATVA